MRVSTGMIFDSGTAGILRNQSSLFKLQNQMSTGRRVLTPADDPVASAQALVTTQAKSVNEQYMENQATAKGQLAQVEGNLDGLTSLLQDIRERSVQLGNASLTDRERSFIASEFKSRFEELVGLANEQNGAGQYLYSGYQGATKPFAVNSPTLPQLFDATNPAADYFGDQGERMIQVEASRQMSVTASGLDVFMRIRNGNGEFSVATPDTAPFNAGSAIADQGSVLDITKWNVATNQPQNYGIQFHVDNTTVPSVTYYNLVDKAVGPPSPSMYSNAVPSPGPQLGAAVPVPVGEWKVYTPGQSIVFNDLHPAFAGFIDPLTGRGDLGINVRVTGDPATGDNFEIKSSANQSIFDTVKNLIAVAEQPIPASAAGNSEFMNDLGAQLTALDRGIENVLRVRATVGTRLTELDALESAGSDRALQYSTRLSGLQDLDYAKAISDLSRQQMQLEAAQASFLRVTSLSLFSQM